MGRLALLGAVLTLLVLGLAPQARAAFEVRLAVIPSRPSMLETHAHRLPYVRSGSARRRIVLPPRGGRPAFVPVPGRGSLADRKDLPDRREVGASKPLARCIPIPDAGEVAGSRHELRLRRLQRRSSAPGPVIRSWSRHHVLHRVLPASAPSVGAGCDPAPPARDSEAGGLRELFGTAVGGERLWALPSLPVECRGRARTEPSSTASSARR